MVASKTGFDLIGDIHGHAESLAALLDRLGYKRHDGVYHHPEKRQMIFLGDLIDGGPHQQAVINIVRPMVEAQSAQCIMGNHEFNAIAYSTLATGSDTKTYCRDHSKDNTHQHQKFLDAYPFGSSDHDEIINWFRTLPLWLELDGLRVIHACWDQALIQRIQREYEGSSHLGEGLLHAASDKTTWQYQAIETLLKGKEIPLPEGQSFLDKYQIPRHHIRIRWWDKTANTYRQAFLGSEQFLTHIPDDEITGDHLIDYAHDAPPVFLGHYWLEGTIEPLASNIACLDYSVARSGGKLVAYRFDGEARIQNDKFVSVSRVEDR